MRNSAPLIAGVFIVAIAIVAAIAFSGSDDGSNKALKVLHLPLRSDGPKSLDPVRGSTTYDNKVCSQVYETLVQYKYLVRPPSLEPLLLSEMPILSEDGLTYHFKLKPNVRFHDDPCFPNGKGRALVSDDVFYSWKRMADDDNLPKSWWLFEGTIAGLDEYREKQNAAEEFDYDAPVEGFQKINDLEFKVVLKEPVQRFMWVLAMFQTSIIPREAVEYYGVRFGRHPVGTGPFTMREDDWIPSLSIILNRNPNYHECYYPNEHMPEDEEMGFDQPAGTRLPIADRVILRMFAQDQPMWLKFRTRQIDYTQVPAEYFGKAFIKRTQELRPRLRREGITGHAIPLLDFIFRGFNMNDPIIGGYTEEKKALRQAISLAIDLDEFNDVFYNGINNVYDGPIPPNLDGYPLNGIAPKNYRGPDIDRARELLAKAGFPDGKGVKPLEFYTSRNRNNQEQSELLRRQLSRIGIEVNIRLVDFSTLIEYVHNAKAQVFGYAWGSDYPDAENNLALFYGPNGSPGSNSFNYNRPEFDELYQKIRSMPPSDERTQLYEQMRDMVIEDTPYVGSMARTRFYLVNPRLKNFRPSEDFYNWMKYLNVDDSAR